MIRRNPRFISVKRKDGTRRLVERKKPPSVSRHLHGAVLREALAAGDGQDYEEDEDEPAS